MNKDLKNVYIGFHGSVKQRKIKIRDIKRIKINDYDGKAEYNITSKAGCCAKNLMPINLLDDLIHYLISVKSDRENN